MNESRSKIFANYRYFYRQPLQLGILQNLSLSIRSQKVNLSLCEAIEIVSLCFKFFQIFNTVIPHAMT